MTRTPADSSASDRTDMESGEPIVAVENVSVAYQNRRLGRRAAPLTAVDGVDLRVERGRSVGVVGESGSGKSTLAKAMVRVLRVSDGRVWWAGRDITTLPEKEIRPLRRNLQMVFQDPFSSLNPRRTVRETLIEPLIVHEDRWKTEADQRVEDVLEAVGLRYDHANRYPHEFSGGQRQRVAIARALMSQPEIIVCDEPVSALDVSIQAQILHLFSDLRRSLGVGYVFIAHDLAVVASITDEVVVMYAGTVVEQGETQTVLRNPRHPYTIGLVSSTPAVRIQNPSLARSVDIRGEPPDPGFRPQGCKFADRCWLRRSLGGPDKCETERPGLDLLEQGDRAVACHFVEETSRSLQGVLDGS